MDASLLKILISLLLSPAVQADWSGYGSVKSQGFSRVPEAPALSPTGIVELNLEGTGTLGRFGRWNFSPWLQAQTPADTQEQVQLEPTQLYVETRGESLKTRWGYQTFFWEGTDLLNPMDLIHARNYRDPLQIRNRPALALSTTYESGAWQWELIYIPRAAAPLLPGEQSPWWPRRKRLPMEAGAEIRIPPGTEYRILDRITLDRALSHNAAFRLVRRGDRGDFSLALFEGLSNDPSVLIDGDVTTLNAISLDPPILEPEGAIGLRPLDIRHRAAAAGFNYAFDRGIFRWAGRTQQPLGEDPRRPSWTAINVFSWEMNFNVRRRDITVISEVFASQRSQEERISFLRSIFDRAAALGTRIPWSDDHEFYGGFVYDAVGASSLSRLIWKARWSDHWSTELELNSLEGPPETLLGVFSDHDRVSLSLRRSF